ncbi:MAG: AbrB/MazE/SpoVT family DNA-binding domain-containing protein [Verrucomicrobia bacterium]|nr:AbrB/MazE/SpoVT family DNA-binding domain-containing protein [Verrucomicrobiota bacterium]
MVATLTSKGQVTIPKTVRSHLRLNAGSRLDFIIGEDGEVRMRPVRTSASKLFGILHRRGERPLTVEEMNAGIARHLRAKHL